MHIQIGRIEKNVSSHRQTKRREYERNRVTERERENKKTIVISYRLVLLTVEIGCRKELFSFGTKNVMK